MYPLTKEHLTKDDLKVIKHLNAVDKLFKRGDLSISQLFVNCGFLYVFKKIDGQDYKVCSFTNIRSDGGDIDDYGSLGALSESELEEYYESKEEE
jgi:hypothetical protein